MPGLQIESLLPREKGRVAVRLDNGVEVLLYKGEARRLSLRDGMEVSDELYHKIIHEIVGLRAKKRAIHLLEQMDRTEHQLYEKLRANGYPEACILDAIDYVKQFRYIDDTRYARTYIRQGQQKKSRQRLKQDLQRKGVSREIIETALEEEYEADECGKIRELLEKRRYKYETSDRKEQQRTYQFLLRRGFMSSDILRVLKTGADFMD